MQIEGRNPVLESLRSDREFIKLIVQKDINRDEKVKQIISKAKNRKVNIKYTSKKDLDRISHTKSHQGFIAIAKDKEYISLEHYLDGYVDNSRPIRLIYIREALYQHNIGAIARSAECAGFNGVILQPKTKITAEADRASAGGLEHIPVFYDGLFSAIKVARDRGIKVVGIEVAGDKYYYEADLTGNVMFIIGGEDRSLSLEILKKCDIIVKIPLLGKVNSLNMSVAASIVMYENLRQEGTKE